MTPSALPHCAPKLSVPLEAIDVPRGLPAPRESDVDRLIHSIEACGLLHPIGLRPDPKAEGRYVLVYGHHRLEAVRRLGEESIEAAIHDVDAAGAVALRLAEDVCREGAGKRGRKTAKFSAEEEQMLISGRVCEEDRKKLRNFDPDIRARMIPLMGEGYALMHAFAVASGMEELRPGLPVPPTAEDWYEMAIERREDWIVRQSADVLARLHEPRVRAAFLREAIFYAKTREARERFYREIKLLLAKVFEEGGGRFGPFSSVVNRAINMEWPASWLTCFNCRGTGETALGLHCDSCYGHGFSCRASKRGV